MSEHRRILIVEDEFAVAMELESRLQELGYRIAGHELRGEEAIERASAEQPDLILMDVRLDGPMDGVEAASLIRQERPVPIVFLTAYSDDETIQRATATGPFGYVVKPFDARELYAAIEVALHTHALKQQVERHRDDLQQILDGLRQGTAMTDADGRITFLSLPAASLLGVTRSTASRRPWREALPFDDAVLDALAARVDADADAPVTATVTHDDDTTVRMEVSVRPDPRDDRRHVFTFYDVTEVHDLREMLDERDGFHNLVGQSDPMQAVFQQIESIAAVDATVLIHGETGTGKELVARALHDESARSGQPFVAVNCAALQPDLAGSQLFGHRKGAFTGAVDDREGYFESAHGGTLFLDEIGDVPLEVQRQMLRVLEERVVTRLGETEERPVDVRIVAATHRDLRAEVDAGRFREDLLYRIRIARLDLPPLRDRRSDLPLLVRTFVRRAHARMGTPMLTVSDAAMRRMLDYDWPGNVRELRNAIESAAIRASGDAIQPDDLPPEIRDPSTGEGPASNGADTPVDAATSEAERIRAALAQTDDNRTAAAELLGISRATLYRRLDELDID